MLFMRNTSVRGITRPADIIVETIHISYATACTLLYGRKCRDGYCMNLKALYSQLPQLWKCHWSSHRYRFCDEDLVIQTLQTQCNCEEVLSEFRLLTYFDSWQSPPSPSPSPPLSVVSFYFNFQANFLPASNLWPNAELDGSSATWCQLCRNFCCSISHLFVQNVLQSDRNFVIDYGKASINP